MFLSPWHPPAWTRQTAPPIRPTAPCAHTSDPARLAQDYSSGHLSVLSTTSSLKAKDKSFTDLKWGIK